MPALISMLKTNAPAFAFNSILACAEEETFITTSAASDCQARLILAKQVHNRKAMSDLFFMRVLVLMQQLKLKRLQ